MPEVYNGQRDSLKRWHSHDIYGCHIDATGNTIDSFTVSMQLDQATSLTLANGDGDSRLVAYSAWVRQINGHPATRKKIHISEVTILRIVDHKIAE